MRRVTLFVSIVSTWLFRGHYVYPLGGRIQDDMASRLLYPSKGTDIAVKWRDKQIEYTRLITQSDPHNPSGSQYFRPFWELTRLSLEYTLDRLKLDRQSGQV